MVERNGRALDVRKEGLLNPMKCLQFNRPTLLWWTDGELLDTHLRH